MNQDAEHLKLLSVFHYVLGGVTAFFGCFPILHVVIGIADLTGQIGHGNRPPGADAFGWMFVIVGGAAILFAWTLAGGMLLCARNLSGRRAYTLCLVTAGLECLLMPLGTVLGIFTLIVLSRPTVKAAFGAAPAEPLEPNPWE
jgi:hypothetical protein